MAASPQHATLTAAAVASLTFDASFDDFEAVNVDGVAIVYFTTDGTTPTVAGTGCQVLPAVAGAALTVTNPTFGAGVVVKLISSGTPKVSVRGF